MWIVNGETFTGEVLTVSAEGYESIGHALMYGYPDALPQDVLVLVDEGTWLAGYGEAQLPNAAFQSRNIYIRGIGARASVIIDWKTQYNLNDTKIYTENCTVLCEGETYGVNCALRYIDNYEAPSTILFNKCDIDAPDLGYPDSVFWIGGDNAEGTNISTALELSYCEIDTEAEFIVYGVPLFGSYDISNSRVTKTISPHLTTEGTTGEFVVADYAPRLGTEPVEDGEERYWVGNAGRWDQEAHWALTSGGAGGASVPSGIGFKAIIDANSITLPGQYISFPIEAFLELTVPVPTLEAPVTSIVHETPVTQDSMDDLTVPVPTLELATRNYNYLGICTVTCPAEVTVVTLEGHGLSDNDVVKFIPESGVIANEIANDYDYYADVIDVDTFNLMVVPSGELMDTTGTQTAVNIKLYKLV